MSERYPSFETDLGPRQRLERKAEVTESGRRIACLRNSNLNCLIECPLHLDAIKVTIAPNKLTASFHRAQIANDVNTKCEIFVRSQAQS